MIVSKKDKIILITPPKTGTHSITNYIKNAGIVGSEPIKSVNYPIYHLTLSEIIYVFDIDKNELKDYKIIQCVRNPYNRMVSAWLHQMSILNKDIMFIDLLNKIKLNKHLLPNNIDDFYFSFYGNLQHKHRSFKTGHWGGLRFYYEQNWFNDIDANIKYFKLENLESSTQELSDFLNIPHRKFPHINKSKHLKSESKYEDFYGEIEKNIMLDLYYNDFKMFNYEL